MNNEIKFQHIKRLWYIRDGVICLRYSNKPVSFSSKTNHRHRLQAININGKQHSVYIHDAIFMLHHDRPIAEGKEIHHIDGNPENNVIENLIELTRTQHQRIHQYQRDNPMRGIGLHKGAWQFRWRDDGKQRARSFHSISEAMTFRDRIEEPRRQELRALGLNCKRTVITLR
ncbi:HNH endonuclease [Escherichia coli]|nr:HNH endonuclease [Escherichia coli]